MIDDDDHSADYWARVETILDQILEAAPDEAEGRIKELAGHDATLESEIRALLGHLPDPEHDDSGPDAKVANKAGRLIGKRLGGVQLTELLGVGGHGEVYRGSQTRPRRTVAVKVIEMPAAIFERAREELLRRFEHEASIIARIEHPGIARMIAAGIDVTEGRPIPYLITDFVENPLDLQSWWASNRDFRTRIDVLRQIVSTVEAAHERGVLHRDLKPSNILVDLEDRPRVIDFGIATVAGDSADEAILGGSAGYASPEQLDPDRGATSRSDIYSLGRIIQVLMEQETEQHARRRNERDLLAVACRAATIDPALRYPTAVSMAEDLTRIHDRIPPEAASPTHTRRLFAAMRRSPLASCGLGLGIVGCIFVLALLLQFQRDLVRARAALERENTLLEASLHEEAAARYGLQLSAIGAMESDPLAARRAILEIDPGRDDFAIRYFRNRLAEDLSADVHKGENAYRVRATADGRRLISGSAHAVRIFEFGDTTPVLVWRGLGPQVYGVAISADGTIGVAGTDDGKLFTLDLTGVQAAPPRLIDAYRGGVILGVDLHPSGRNATIIGGDGAVHWIDLTQDPPSSTSIPLELNTRWCSIDTTRSGDRVVAAGYDGRFAILDAPLDGGPPTEMDITHREIEEQAIRTIRWSPDGTSIAMVGGDRVTVTDPDGRVRTSRRLPTNSLWALAWSPDGTRLAVSGWDQMLRILDAETLEQQHDRFGADGPVWTLAWVTPSLIGSGEENAAVRWWSARAPTQFAMPLPSSPTHAHAPVDGGLLVACRNGALYHASDRRKIFRERVAPVTTGQCEGVLDDAGFHRIVGDRLERYDFAGELQRVVTIDAAPQNTTLWRDSRTGRYAARLDDRIVMLDGGSGDILVETPFTGIFARDAGFDTEGRFHLACGFDPKWSGVLQLDPNDGVARDVPDIRGSNLRAAHRLRNGWILATSTNDAFIFDPDDPTEPPREIDFAHAGGTNVICTIDDGATLVTGGTDGLVRLWTLPEFTSMLRVEGTSKASVTSIDVIDDDRIFIGRVDGTVQLLEALSRPGRRGGTTPEEPPAASPTE